MVQATKLGIWMDHSNAHLIEFPADNHPEKLLASTFTHQQKVNALSKSENLMHNKEQRCQPEVTER